MIAGLTRRLASSYRLRLTLGYVAVMVVLGAAWLGSLFGPLTAAVTSQQRTHLASVARAGALALEDGKISPQRLARRLGGPDLRVTIVASEGRVLADNQNDPARMENHAGRPEVAAALAGSMGQDVRRSRTEGVDQLYVAVPSTLAGQRVAVRVSESLASIGALAAGARDAGLVLLVAAIAVSAFVTARLASNAAAPVTRLAETAGAIARGESRDVAREPGELGVVSDALEDLGRQVRRRIAEAEAEQENLRAVLDGLDDGVVLLEDGVVRLANDAMSRLFRPPFGGWPDRRLENAGLPPSLLPVIREAELRAVRSTTELDRDPTGRALRVVVVPLSAEDEARRTLVVISDVTERVRLDAVRRDFVANASHELKTPAATLQLLSESAAAAAEDGDAEQSLAFLRQMRPEADRLRKLVADLLDLSRLEQTPSAEALTDLRAAIDLALAAHRPAAEAKGLALSADLAEVADVDVYVAADPTDLAVALDNLLANAIAYTERGEVSVRAAIEDERVRIDVSDTGVGIPAEVLPRVFERFFRVDKARSRDSGGTGLGLSLVRHVVERSGGEVAIASEPGAGTTVTLRLARATYRASSTTALPSV